MSDHCRFVLSAPLSGTRRRRYLMAVDAYGGHCDTDTADLSAVVSAGIRMVMHMNLPGYQNPGLRTVRRFDGRQGRTKAELAVCMRML